MMTNTENSKLLNYAIHTTNGSKACANGMGSTNETASYHNSSSHLHLSDKEVRDIIAEYAYYKAQQRGFEPGHDFQDWIASEKDITDKLAFLGIDFTDSQ